MDDFSQENRLKISQTGLFVRLGVTLFSLRFLGKNQTKSKTGCLNFNKEGYTYLYMSVKVDRNIL